MSISCRICAEKSDIDNVFELPTGFLPARFPFNINVRNQGKTRSKSVQRRISSETIARTHVQQVRETSCQNDMLEVKISEETTSRNSFHARLFRNTLHSRHDICDMPKASKSLVWRDVFSIFLPKPYGSQRFRVTNDTGQGEHITLCGPGGIWRTH